MAVYQCPDCLELHGEATEPVLGMFVRCAPCELEAWLTAVREDAATHVPAEAA